MVEFTYKNAKNASLGYMFFEFNYRYYLCIFYKKEKFLDLYFNLKIMEKLFSELWKLMTIYQQNLYYAQKL